MRDTKTAPARFRRVKNIKIAGEMPFLKTCLGTTCMKNVLLYKDHRSHRLRLGAKMKVLDGQQLKEF
ncbi:MAG: hypothetical protein WBF33_00775 [Candidatus Nitrosopolaris sp.]